MARLIDADKLREDDELTMWLSTNAIRTGKLLKTFSELFVKKIDSAPTVEAIPVEWIQRYINACEMVSAMVTEMSALSVKAMLEMWKEEQKGDQT